MSRAVVMPLARRRGRMKSRLPVGSEAPVRWTWDSTRPGIRNLPVASTMGVLLGREIEEEGPIAATCWPSRRTVVSGRGGVPVASMTVA